MGGAFISLLLSRFMAKHAMGVQVIDPDNARGDERALVQRVHRLCQRAGIGKMPEVGIYDSPELNAFATGPTRNSALVAVSTGLLQRMNEEEVEGVLGHEITHIANGDMVTMTLLQGVINAFAMFLSRVLAYAISMGMGNRNDRESEGSPWMFYLFTMVFDILFTLLGSLVTAAFSRWREFRADAGGARLAGRDKMVAALRRLQSAMDRGVEEDTRAPALAAFKISHKSGMLSWFASHPPLEERIRRLERGSAS